MAGDVGATLGLARSGAEGRYDELVAEWADLGCSGGFRPWNGEVRHPLSLQCDGDVSELVCRTVGCPLGASANGRLGRVHRPPCLFWVSAADFRRLSG